MPSSRPSARAARVPTPIDSSSGGAASADPARSGCAVITGAAGAIGAAIAARFKAAGYRICGIDRVEPPAASVLDLSIQADLHAFVNDERAREDTLARIRDWLAGQPLRALINNAAHQYVSRVHPIAVAEWQRSYDVNVLAPYLLVSHLAAELERGGGSVVNIGSIHARLTKPGFLAYATTKAALGALTRGLALDFEDRFRVNCVEPASVDTPMLQDGFRSAPEKLQELRDHHPQRRIASAAEVAELVFQINSHDLRFLHGSCIDMSGGIGARLHDPL